MKPSKKGKGKNSISANSPLLKSNNRTDTNHTESAKDFFLKSISFYQKRISPLFPARCRYYPTCSAYMFTAIERFGAFRGVILGIRRLMRCNILFPGGYDPVPENPEQKK